MTGQVEVLTCNDEAKVVHLRFMTHYSSEAFEDWVLDDPSFGIVANSQRIVMSLDSEPFVPAPASDETEKKRTVESLYNYYSYLLMEANREKLFSQTERYKELAIMAEVQRATADVLPSHLLEAKRATLDEPPNNPLLEMNINDEFTSLALGFSNDRRPQVSSQHLSSAIGVRYTKDQVLRIYKTLGQFESPLSHPHAFKLQADDPEIREIFESLTTPKPDVVIELVREDIEMRKQRALK